MSRAIRNGQSAILSCAAEVESHLLDKITRATAGLIGLEQEMFVTTPAGAPPAFARIEAVLRHMAAHLPKAQVLTEKEYVVGLTIADIGDVCLEPGGQVELSCAPARGLAEMQGRQQALYDALVAAAQAEGLVVQGAGHLPAFIGAPMVPRSRFAAYADYCTAVHGAEKTSALLGTMKSCTGLQVNVDPMGEDFHAIYRALMAVELAGAFSEKTMRHQMFSETYAPLFPKQVTPMFNAVAARDNATLVGLIVTRLLTLNVPFVPDPESAEGFLPSAKVYGHTPTVAELMEMGVLTGDLLDNTLSLQMTMPNLRRHGVVETRNPDTPADMAGVMAVAGRYHAAAYDAPTRDRLVAVLERCNPDDLARAYANRFTQGAESFDRQPVGEGVTVAAFVRAVESALVEKRSPQKACTLKR